MEACEPSGPVSILFPQLPHMALSGLFKRARCTSAMGGAGTFPATVQLMAIYEYTP